MDIQPTNSWLIKSLQPLCHKMGRGRGNILVYLVMVILIFGVLGVTMVSLFSTSISSSATPNYERRAFFLYESGLRYAASELINNTPNFSSTTIDTLNATTYNLSPSGTFRLRVFGQRFESESLLNPGAAGNSLNLRVEKGEIPDDYAVPTDAPRISVVNYNYFSSPAGDASAEISGFSRTDNTHFSLTIADSLVIGRGELVSFAAPSRSNLDQNGITAGGELFLEPQAGNILPINSGAVEIDRNRYFYRKWVPESGYVKLVGLQSPDNKFPLDVPRDTYVLLSPQNYAILPEGRSGEVTYGWKWDPKYVGNLHELTLQPLSRKPDIDFTEEENLPSVLDLNVSRINPSLIGVDNSQKSIVISGSSGFGSVLFDDTRPIGGRTNFCVADTILENGLNRTGCLFESGIRVFFILDFNHPGPNFPTSNDADGLTFSIINGTLNDSSSVGGDFELSELLAYAGDSREDATPSFLDGRGEGIEAPKMAVEFDGRSNNPTLSICSNATTVNENTRNDPTTDAVHYVFWGKNTSIDAPCRSNNKTYDDNRHDFIAQKWAFNTVPNAQVRSSPAVDPADGSIYFGSGNPNTVGEARIYGLNPDGTVKSGWPFDPPDGSDDDVEGDPILDSSRNVYIGTDGNLLFSFTPGGTKRWPPGSPPAPNLNGQAEGRSAISGNRVFVNTEGSFFAFDKDSGNQLWSRDIGSRTSLQLSSPIAAPDGTIYVTSMDGNVYSLSPVTGNDNAGWPFSTGSDPIFSTPARNPKSGPVLNFIHVAVDGKLYTITPGGSGSFVRFDAGGSDIIGTPAVSSDGRTVYVGSSNGVLYAVNVETNTVKWRHPTTGNLSSILASPTIDPEGTIVFGAGDGHLYGVQDKGTKAELFWQFPEAPGSIGAVESSPAINNGIIYFGSDDGHLYAVEPAFSNPRNLKNPYLDSTGIGATVADTANWLKSGPWAVRMEITRNKDVPNANGNYDYTLKTWMRQCSANCTNVLGTFYQDTRVEYQYVAAGAIILEQAIELSAEDHARFNRFIFGFTSATSVSQSISIDRFQLSFIRPNDPIISNDPNWP